MVGARSSNSWPAAYGELLQLQLQLMSAHSGLVWLADGVVRAPYLGSMVA